MNHYVIALEQKSDYRPFVKLHCESDERHINELIAGLTTGFPDHIVRLFVSEPSLKRVDLSPVTESKEPGDGTS